MFGLWTGFEKLIRDEALPEPWVRSRARIPLRFMRRCAGSIAVHERFDPLLSLLLC